MIMTNMKTFSQYPNFEFGVFISVIHNHHNYDKWSISICM